MNANFTFPPPQPAVPRPAPAAKSSSSSPDLAGSRESNVLRASILDTALELGIGSSPLVADWIFNNPLIEEADEEEPVPSPGLTYGSPTSKLFPSPLLLHSQYRRDPVVNVNGHSPSLNLNQNVNMSGPLIYQGRNAVPVRSNRISDTDSQFSNVRVRFNPNEVASNVNVSNFQKITVNDSVAPFLDIPIPPRPTTPSGRKLRKKRAGGSGYESDGGYVSDNGKRKDKKRENSSDLNQRLKEDGKEEDRKKKKSFIQVINKMSTSNDVQSPTKGYETDGGALPSSSKRKGKITKSKTKDPSNETGYETDGGYQSSSGLKKSKTRFFRLPTKSSKSSLHADASGSVPALPNSAEKKSELIVPLPIAERFATTLSPSSTLRDSISTYTMTEVGGSRMGSPLPTLAFQPFAATSELTSPSPSPRPSVFNRPATAPTSASPSAFNANATHLEPKKRDSRSSIISSSSSGSGSNQHNKSTKRFGLFSPLHSPPSSMQGQREPGLRTASSLSSLRPTISLPITRATSPTPTVLPPSSLLPHSRSVSPLPPSVSPTMSVAPLQINKVQRINHRPDNLPLPSPQYSSSQSVPPSPELGSPHVHTAPFSQTPSPGPGYPMVRPRNPPIDGFGPRSAPIPNPTTSPYSIPSPGPTPVASTPSNDALSPHSYTEGHPQRISQLSIIPSSDYIVPSPRHSPLKMHSPGIPNPNVLAAYYHHDNVPPPPNPAPMGPLPTLPSSGSGSPVVPNGNSAGSPSHFPSVAQLRQRMTLMRRSVQQDYGFGLSSAQRGREPPSPVPLPSQSTVANGSVSVDGAGPESRSGMRRYQDWCPLGNNGVKPGAEEARRAKVATNRKSWIEIDDDVSSNEKKKPEVEDQEAEEAEELYDILDRFEDHSNESSDSSLGGQALGRTHSFKARKVEEEQQQQPQRHPDSFEARPRQNNKVPADIVARGISSGFEDDGRTVGDRTSRWSGSVYSCASILDQYESEETRDRFVKRVEAMLDAEKTSKSKALGHGVGGQAQTYIPPLPKMPDVYANIAHKKNWNNVNGNAGVHSNNTTPGRSWNKF